MRFINRKTLAIAGVAAALVAVGSDGHRRGGQPDRLLRHPERERPLGGPQGRHRQVSHDLSKQVNDKLAKVGAQGPKGDNAYENAYYAVAFYNKGDTNAGAIATVACKATERPGCLRWRAGARPRRRCKPPEHPGVVVLPRTHGLDHQHPVRPNRLDGWIVQFGGNAQTAGALATRLPRR